VFSTIHYNLVTFEVKILLARGESERTNPNNKKLSRTNFSLYSNLDKDNVHLWG